MKTFNLRYYHIVYFLSFLTLALTVFIIQNKINQKHETQNDKTLTNTKIEQSTPTLRYEYVINYRFDSMYHSDSEKESRSLEYKGELSQTKIGNSYFYENNIIDYKNQNNIDQFPEFLLKDKTELHLHKDENGFSGEIKRLLTSALQFSPPKSPATEWQATENLGIGEVIAKYQRQRNGRTNKHILNILTNEEISSDTALRNMTPPHVTSWFELTNGIIDKAFYKVEQKKKSKTTDITFDITTSVKINLIEIASEKQTNDFANHISLPLYVYRNYHEEEPKNSHTPYLKQDVLLEKLNLLSLKPDDDLFWPIRDDLINSVENSEEFGRHIVDLIGETHSDTLQSHLIGLLGQTSNNEGQKRLIELLKNNDFSTSIKQQALMQFSLMNNPSKASFEAVKEFSKSEKSELRTTSILAIGKIIENWTANESANIDDTYLDNSISYIHENYLNATTEIDKSIALSALGNSGLPENKVIIEEALNESNEMLRSKAIRALRKDLDDNATQIILNSAKFDTSPKVRKTALETLKNRPSNVNVSEAINKILLDEQNEDVRISALHTAAYVNANKDELLHLLDNLLADGADGKFMLEALKLQEYLRDS